MPAFHCPCPDSLSCCMLLQAWQRWSRALRIGRLWQGSGGCGRASCSPSPTWQPAKHVAPCCVQPDACVHAHTAAPAPFHPHPHALTFATCRLLLNPCTPTPPAPLHATPHAHTSPALCTPPLPHTQLAACCLHACPHCTIPYISACCTHSCSQPDQQGYYVALEALLDQYLFRCFNTHLEQSRVRVGKRRSRHP